MLPHNPGLNKNILELFNESLETSVLIQVCCTTDGETEAQTGREFGTLHLKLEAFWVAEKRRTLKANEKVKVNYCLEPFLGVSHCVQGYPGHGNAEGVHVCACPLEYHLAEGTQRGPFKLISLTPTPPHTLSWKFSICPQHHPSPFPTLPSAPDQQRLWLWAPLPSGSTWPS